MIEEREIVDAITYRDEGYIEVRKAFLVIKDGIEIARQYHRHVIAPGDDLTGEDPKVVAMAEQFWTDELIERERAKRDHGL